MTVEEWKPIPTFEDSYSVSNLGRVRSEARRFTRSSGWKFSVRERILKPVYGKGERTPHVRLAHRGQYTRVRPHELAEALFGPHNGAQRQEDGLP